MAKDSSLWLELTQTTRLHAHVTESPSMLRGVPSPKLRDAQPLSSWQAGGARSGLHPDSFKSSFKRARALLPGL